MRLSKFKLVLREEPTEYQIDEYKQYTRPEYIADFALDFIGLRNEIEEYAYCLCFDSKLHIIGFFEVSHGSETRAMFSMKSIFQKALFMGAYGIILVHNHPSGDVTPSTDDMNATKRLVECGKILELKVMDHIIVGGKSGDWKSLLNGGRR